MWLRRLYRRFRGLVHEVSKFGAVGAVAYLIDTGIFLVLLMVGVESLTAKAAATVVAASAAFVGNRFWTWRHRARSGIAREYGLYFFFNAVGLGIALAILGISHYGLGHFFPVFTTKLADLIAGSVVGLIAGTIFRFWAYRTFVFRPVDVAGGHHHSAQLTRLTPSERGGA